MPGFVISQPELPSVAGVGSDARFPVRRIFCIGRNYAEHAKEMGVTATRDRPFLFCKPAAAVVDDSATVPYPPLTTQLHYHEAELVVAIGAEGRNLSVDAAPSIVWGYAAVNDLTRRDLQQAAPIPGDSAMATARALPTFASTRKCETIIVSRLIPRPIRQSSGSLQSLTPSRRFAPLLPRAVPTPRDESVPQVGRE